VSKVVRTSSAVAAGVLAVSSWAVPAAFAAAATESASAGGYFSSTGVPDTGTDAGKPPNLTADADGVAPGHLAVAGGNGREQKVSFLRFDLLDLEFGSTITSARLTVPLAPDGDGNVNARPAPEKVRACPAGPEGFGGEDGAAIGDAPARLCDQASAPAEPSEDGKSYVFDLTAIAAGWADMNDGVALTVAEDASPFQVVFRPAEEATLSYEATPPADTSLPGGGAGTQPDFGNDTGSDGFAGGLGGGFDGGFDSGTDAGLGSGSFDDGGFGSVDSPVVSEGELPVPDGEATAAEPQVALSPAVPAGFGESLRPTASFWLGALLFAAVLALLSLIMGDPRLPAANARQSRLSQALQARDRGASRSGFGATPATF
jgi:hypothetical protein